MNTHILRHLNGRNLRLISLATLCVAGAFVTGIRSAGEVHPFEATQAQQADLVQQELDGDVNGNGITDIDDAIALLTILHGDTDQAAQALHGDLDGDGSLTIDDALLLLRRIAHP